MDHSNIYKDELKTKNKRSHDLIRTTFKSILNETKVLNTIQRIIIAIYFSLVLIFFGMAIYFALF